MKSLRTLAALFGIFAILGPFLALADTRVIVYSTENPTSNDTNSVMQLDRISKGGFMRDALGPTLVASGAYSGMACSPGTGLYVTTGPTGAYGDLYQQVANDPNPLPTGGYPSPLPASTIQTVVAAQQTTVSAPLGPLTAPGGGLSTYYLIEFQVGSTDTNSQSRAFVSSTGSKTFASVNVNRIDSIAYQVKAGTPSATPSIPAVDSGYTAMCTALIPNGRSQVLSGDIAPVTATQFTGFTNGANVVNVSPTASPSPNAGNAAITGTMAASQFVATATGTAAPFVVSGTGVVANLTAQFAQSLSPSPTPSAIAPIVKTGTFPNLVYSCPTCVVSVGATNTTIVIGGTATAPTIAVTAAPNFSLVTTPALTLSGFSTGCLTNTSGVVSSTGTACGGGSGVVYNATSPIVVATPSGQANFSLASPAATAQPSACAGWSASFAMQYATASCGLVGVTKTAYTITVLPTATALATPTAGFYSRAFMVSEDIVSPTVDGAYGYCDTAGSGSGLVTFQFYETFGQFPTFATANPIATAVSWATGSSVGGGATFAPTALPTSTTPGNPTWVFAVVKAIPAVAPTGACSFELHGLQRLIQ